MAKMQKCKVQLTRQRAIKRLLLGMTSHMRPQRIPASMRHSLPRAIIPLTRIRRLSSADMVVMNVLHQPIHIPQVLPTPVPSAHRNLLVVLFIMRLQSRRTGDRSGGVGADVGRARGWRMRGEGGGGGAFPGRCRGTAGRRGGGRGVGRERGGDGRHCVVVYSVGAVGNGG